jgi:hypothetical protein
MGSLSQTEQRKLAYFHALGKSMTQNSQAVYESKYKSAHNVRLSEIWSDKIDYAVDFSTAVSNAGSSSAVTYYDQVEMTAIPGSNSEAWYFNSGGTFIRPWISPVDVPDVITNEPSYGYELRLFRGDDATSGTPGSEIFLTEGAWVSDYYTGVIHFGEGETPVDRGWGTIKATVFQYTGNFGASGTTNAGFTSVYFDSGTSELIFNQGQPSEDSVNLNTLKEKLSSSDIGLIANITNSGATLASNSGITDTVVDGSSVRVFVNGVEISVGVDCYFSPDLNGTTIRTVGTEKQGDYLHWTYTGTSPNIGYDLSNIDRITFLYLTNS